MTLQIKQDFDYKSEGYWLWSVWIDGREEEINNIASVRYTLHPSYTSPVRIVKNQSTKLKWFPTTVQPEGRIKLCHG